MGPTEAVKSDRKVGEQENASESMETSEKHYAAKQSQSPKIKQMKTSPSKPMHVKHLKNSPKQVAQKNEKTEPEPAEKTGLGLFMFFPCI